MAVILFAKIMFIPRRSTKFVLLSPPIVSVCDSSWIDSTRRTKLLLPCANVELKDS